MSDVKRGEIFRAVRGLERDECFDPLTCSHPGWIEKTSLILEWLKPEPSSLILDCGCGDWCAVSEFLASKGFEVMALDIAPTMKDRVRDREVELAVHRLRGDCEELPLKEGSFDRVLCWSVLHHLPHYPSVLNEISRVLKIGGLALFAEPNKLSPFQRIREIKFHIKERIGMESSFILWILKAQLKTVGLDVIKVEPMGYTETEKPSECVREYYRAKRKHSFARKLWSVATHLNHLRTFICGYYLIICKKK